MKQAKPRDLRVINPLATQRPRAGQIISKTTRTRSLPGLSKTLTALDLFSQPKENAAVIMANLVTIIQPMLDCMLTTRRGGRSNLVSPQLFRVMKINELIASVRSALSASRSCSVAVPVFTPP
jgi:hypothetical protein